MTKRTTNRGHGRELAQAIAAGDVDAVRAGLAAGADPNLPGETGSLALGSAVVAGSGAVHVLRSDRGLDAPKPHAEIVRILVEAGADLGAVDGMGLPPLAWAAKTGSAEMVGLLLELGAEPGQRSADTDRDDGGATALGHACGAVRQQHLDEVVRLLLEAGAEPDAASRSGSTPLHGLCRRLVGPEALAALSRLLAAGADPARRDGLGYTPLMTLVEEIDPGPASDSPAADARRLLIEHGASDAELAPLRLVEAADDGDAELVSELIAEGAPATFRTFRGETALTAAAAAGHLEVVDLLLDHVNGNEIGSGFLAAARAGRLEVAERLLAAGADPNAGPAWGRPLDAAAAGSPVAAWLESIGAVRTTLATERGCPNLDLTQMVILVRAPLGDVVAALERRLDPARVVRDVQRKKTPIASASLLVYQLAGHEWTTIQPVSGSPAANRFERATGAALSIDLDTDVVLYDNSDVVGTVAFEHLGGGETRELVYYGESDGGSLLVPAEHAASFRKASDAADDSVGGLGVHFVADGEAVAASDVEEYLDRRARELGLLVPSWSPADLAAKPGRTKNFFSQEKKATFVAVDYVAVEA